MSDSLSLTVRAMTPDDASVAALLRNSTQEPHFHTTAARLKAAIVRDPDAHVVGERGGRLTGMATLWLPDFHPGYAWVGLHIHPDHRQDGTAAALLDRLLSKVRAAGRSHLWASVREDYLPTWPDLPALEFREVHRTFGGGFHLKGWGATTVSLPGGYTLHPAGPQQDDRTLAALYALTRGDKVDAPPTIPPAANSLADEDSLWDAAFLVRHREEVVGLALPERAGLGAWNGVLIVHPQHRRRGLGTALQVEVARALQAQRITFLNTAGSGADVAYLGVLRRSGARIEPDWIAFEREA